MEAIMDFLESIGDFFETILEIVQTLFDFVWMLIDGVLWLIGVLPDLVLQVSGLFAYAPSFVGVFLTCSLSIIVLYAVFKLI